MSRYELTLVYEPCPLALGRVVTIKSRHRFRWTARLYEVVSMIFPFPGARLIDSFILKTQPEPPQ